MKFASFIVQTSLMCSLSLLNSIDKRNDNLRLIFNVYRMSLSKSHLDAGAELLSRLTLEKQILELHVAMANTSKIHNTLSIFGLNKPAISCEKSDFG